MIKYILLQCFWQEYLDFPYLIQGGLGKLCTNYILVQVTFGEHFVARLTVV